jgi:hypothetical protein
LKEPCYSRVPEQKASEQNCPEVGYEMASLDPFGLSSNECPSAGFVCKWCQSLKRMDHMDESLIKSNVPFFPLKKCERN